MNDTIRSRANGDFDVGRTPFPPIDLDALKPGARCDRNRPIMTLSECMAAEELAALSAVPGNIWYVDTPPAAPARAHSHYFKDVSKLQTVDVYRVVSLFNVTDPCLQHAIKKLLVAGGRGAGKDISQDIKEAIDSLRRWQEMRAEEVAS
jgi:hypothetical protein